MNGFRIIRLNCKFNRFMRFGQFLLRLFSLPYERFALKIIYKTGDLSRAIEPRSTTHLSIN